MTDQTRKKRDKKISCGQIKIALVRGDVWKKDRGIREVQLEFLCKSTKKKLHVDFFS